MPYLWSFAPSKLFELIYLDFPCFITKCSVANIIEIILIILIREMDQIVRVHQYSRSSIVALFVVKAARDDAKIEQ